jgi:hypothetical protein
MTVAHDSLAAERPVHAKIPIFFAARASKGR